MISVFNPLTTLPCDTIIKRSSGDYYLCRQGDHVSVITGNGDCITDFVIPFLTDQVSISDSHYAFSFKKLDKNHISYLTADHAIFELRKDMEYAYVDYQGNLLVPFCGYKESKKKMDKLFKSIVPMLQDFDKNHVLPYQTEAEILNRNTTLAKDFYPSQFPEPQYAIVKEQAIKKNKKGKVIQKAGKFFSDENGTQQSELYKDIQSLENHFYLVQNFDKLFAIANGQGTLITPFKYQQFEKWSTEQRNVTYRVKTEGKFGLIKLPEEIILPAEYKIISPLQHKFAILIETDSTGTDCYYTIDKDAKLIANYCYDNIEKLADNTFKATFSALECTVILDSITGKELSPTLQEQYFDEVVEADLSPEEAIESYKIMLEMGGPATDRIYNNLGVIYESLGDNKLAREYLKKSEDMGCETATENLRIMDEQEAEQRRQQQTTAVAEESVGREILDTTIDLLGSLSELFGESTTTGTSSYTEANDYHSDTSSSSGSSTKVRANDKCPYCQGTGKHISIHAHSKNVCGGNGKCGWCGGSGTIHVAGAGDVLCPNCERKGNGKCKLCHGTGKCPHCHGTGLK